MKRVFISHATNTVRVPYWTRSWPDQSPLDVEMSWDELADVWTNTTQGRRPTARDLHGDEE